MYELDVRRADGTGGWSTTNSKQPVIEVQGLDPGTKYAFRARGGFTNTSEGSSEEAITWGEYSVESSYVTSGGRVCGGGGEGGGGGDCSMQNSNCAVFFGFVDTFRA